MDATTQEQIDAIRSTLEQVKAHSGIGPEDPTLIALERIMLARIAVLEADSKPAPSTVLDSQAGDVDLLTSKFKTT